MDFGVKYMFIYVTLTNAVVMSQVKKPTSEVNKTAEILTIKGPPPNGVIILFMDQSQRQSFNYSMECNDDNQKYFLKPTPDDNFLVTLETNTITFDCINRTLEVLPTVVHSFTGNDDRSSVSYRRPKQDNLDVKQRYTVKGTFVLNFNGEMIGRTFITFRLFNSSNLSDKASQDVFQMTKLPAIIFRQLRPVDHAFQVVIYVFLVFVTLAFGCKLDLEVVKETFKRPIAPCIGMFCQFIVMPLIGYGVAKVVTRDRPDVALGIFVAGCCPGGGASNIYSYLLGGDLSLSITMTAMSTVLAFGMMPLWIYTLGQTFIPGDVHVPFLNIFTTLLVLILPLFVGLFIKSKLPKLQKILLKIIKPITVVCMILLLSVGIYSNLYIFKLFEPRIVLAGCLLPYFGYVIGGVIALIARLPWERVKTVAIETGMQNVGVAMILMMYAFPPPDGMIAAVAPIASAVMTPLPLFVITIPYLIYRKCNKDKYKSVSTDKEKDEEMKDLPSDEPVKTKNGEALLS